MFLVSSFCGNIYWRKLFHPTRQSPDAAPSTPLFVYTLFIDRLIHRRLLPVTSGYLRKCHQSDIQISKHTRRIRPFDRWVSTVNAMDLSPKNPVSTFDNMQGHSFYSITRRQVQRLRFPVPWLRSVHLRYWCRSSGLCRTVSAWRFHLDGTVVYSDPALQCWR